MQAGNWDDLRHFLETARAGGFAGAARALRVDETTVSRRVARLERALGAPLFRREAGRLTLTERGLRACADAEAMEGAYGRLAGESAARGRVRVTAAAILVNRLLAPRAGPLLAAHPGLEVDLMADAADLSIMDREADVALRLARPRREGRAIARRLADLEYRAYRRPGGGAGWIDYGPAMRHVPQHAWTEEAAGGAFAPVTVNDAETLLAAIRSGAGVGFLPAFVGDAEPDLAPVHGVQVRTRELWLLLHPLHRELERIRVAADWVAAAVGSIGAASA